VIAISAPPYYVISADNKRNNNNNTNIVRDIMSTLKCESEAAAVTRWLRMAVEIVV